MKENIHIYKDVEALCEGFTSFLREVVEEKEQTSISLSGGSTPKALFNYWAEKSQDNIKWEKLSFFWGDERCVPPTDEMSNYGMTKELLFDKVGKIKQENIHRIVGENDPQQEADRYGHEIDKFVTKAANIPSFDIMMLGLGDDGHTVSIFPDQIALWNYQNNCVVAEHPETKMKRVSLTGAIVNNAREIVFLVTGKSKAEKVKQIIEQQMQYYDTYPAARVEPYNGNLHWFLDQEAASLL